MVFYRRWAIGRRTIAPMESRFGLRYTEDQLQRYVIMRRILCSLMP